MIHQTIIAGQKSADTHFKLLKEVRVRSLAQQSEHGDLGVACVTRKNKLAIYEY